MTSTTTAIQLAGIAKSYDDQAALRGIDRTVPTGTVNALLGPNRGRQDHDGPHPVRTRAVAGLDTPPSQSPVGDSTGEGLC